LKGAGASKRQCQAQRFIDSGHDLVWYSTDALDKASLVCGPYLNRQGNRIFRQSRTAPGQSYIPRSSCTVEIARDWDSKHRPQTTLIEDVV
jgi:hypothetical protein